VWQRLFKRGSARISAKGRGGRFSGVKIHRIHGANLSQKSTPILKSKRRLLGSAGADAPEKKRLGVALRATRKGGQKPKTPSARSDQPMRSFTSTMMLAT
jgi:hypothetical protein